MLVSFRQRWWCVTNPKIWTSDVRQCFARRGTVLNVSLKLDREKGRSQGFAFITLGDDQAPEATIRDLNGAVWGGRQILVERADRSPYHELIPLLNFSNEQLTWMGSFR